MVSVTKGYNVWREMAGDGTEYRERGVKKWSVSSAGVAVHAAHPVCILLRLGETSPKATPRKLFLRKSMELNTDAITSALQAEIERYAMRGWMERMPIRH